MRGFSILGQKEANMEMHFVNQPDDTGHCLSEPVSRKFLMMAQNGTLAEVSALLQERAEVVAKLQQVEQQLRSCNDPYAVSHLVEWYAERKKNFAIAFTKRVKELERWKSQLAADLQRIDERLALLNLGFEWTIMTGFVSLVPGGSFDAAVELRSLIIYENRGKGKSHQDICRILDSTFRAGERPEGFFREEWAEKYRVNSFLEAYRHQYCRNLVDKMLSSAKRRWP